MLKQWTSEGLLPPNTTGKLSRFLDLLTQWNARTNLTGLRSRPEMEEILIGESLFAAKALSLAGKSVLDVGSGAGIPGIVWAIFDPTIRLTSLEARDKKVAFQKEVQRDLSLSVEILKGLFPDAVSGRQFDILVTRAVRYTTAFEKQAISSLLPGGSVVRFVAANATEEGWESRAVSPRAAILIRQF
jgi:16S rRNA (guanine527-N7)-methyltransferase